MTSLKESLRRVYGELVRGRTRVRIVTDVTDAGVTYATPPRFVLSLYRSGTTLLRYCLDSHPDLASPPETDFLTALAHVLEDDHAVTGICDLGFTARDLEMRLAALGRGFLDSYARSHSTRNWVDKSPRYAESPELIWRLFPQALFIVMHRHPLDQIYSFTRGGTFAHPALSTEAVGRELILAAARYWSDVSAGLIAHARNTSTQTLTIRYEDLCDSPQDVLQRVILHLALPWDAEVLEYHRHSHDPGREAGRVVGTVGFKRSSGYWRRWSRGFVDDLWAVVHGPAVKLGYDLDGPRS